MMEQIITKAKIDLKMYRELRETNFIPEIEKEIKMDYCLIFQVKIPEHKSIEAIIEDLEDFLSFVDNN